MGKDQKEITRRNFLELVAVGAAGAAVSGLGAPSAFGAASKTAIPKAGVPKKGGTLKAGVGWLIQTPDVHRRQGGWARIHMAFIYEGLTTPLSKAERKVMIQQKGSKVVTDVKPMLASSWEVEKGGTRYVFHLKKGVKFHNGKELDSKDIEWNWKRIQDPVHAATSRKFLTLYLKSIETPDKYTVVANLSQPYGAFLMANAWPFTPIMPKDAVPHGVIWGETQTFTPPTPGPPGTGPFKLVSFQQKAEAVMEAHKDYRIPGLPYIDKVILKVISEPGPQTMAVRAGDIDFACGEIDRDWVAKMLVGKDLYKVQMLEREGLGIYTTDGPPSAIYLNSHTEKGNSPFKDERVRKAMDHCLDRAKIAATLFGRMGIPTGQGFDQTISPWYFPDINYSEYNTPKAKQLLKEAGYPNGVDVNFHIDPSWGRHDLLAQMVQQLARPAGFRVKIVPELGVQFWNRLRTYEYHMLTYQLGGEDPMNFYYPYLHTDPADPYFGRSPALGVKDPEMDKLLEAMAGENNFDKRKAALKKVVLRSQEKAYCLPYLTPVGAIAWGKRLKNFKPEEYFAPIAALVEAWLEA